VATGGEQSFKMKFKTEICKFWQLNGTCEYAETCSFAHGNHELKQRTDMPRNYKTKQCKRFHKELYCPYGPRCQFLHDKVPAQAADKKKPAPKVVVESAAASSVSYSDLLNTAEPLAFTLDQLAIQVEPDISGVPEIEAVSNRRLRVFENIPLSLNDSQTLE